MTIRRRVHIFASSLIGGLYRWCCRIGFLHPKVVVYVDGGICCQMNQYLLGQMYAEKGEDVYYDIDFYTDWGKDVDGRFERKFELLDAFNHLKFNTLSRRVTWFYRMFLKYCSRSFLLPDYQPRQPICLGGYYVLPSDVYRHLFKTYYSSVQLPDIRSDYKLCSCGTVCAVHIRRGDLSAADNLYYGGTTLKYFMNAVNYVKTNFMHPFFLFFSDEMDYVEREVIPMLSVDYRIMRENNKAYEDLLCIASCDVIIASVGSFGKIGALLNGHSLLIMQADGENHICDAQVGKWSSYYDNVTLIQG